jgi:tetratricopeptide (TPR) repeat protein
VHSAREQLDVRYLQTWRSLAERALQHDHEHDATQALMHAATVEPWNESLQTKRVQLLLRAGNTSVAALVLKQTGQAVQRHLETEPDFELTRLERLAHQLSRHLPFGEPPFVGGHTHLATTALKLVQRGRISVTGPPGSGRSRYALALATEAVTAHSVEHAGVVDGARTLKFGRDAPSHPTACVITVLDATGDHDDAPVAVPPLTLPQPGSVDLDQILRSSAGRLALTGFDRSELPERQASVLTQLVRITGGNPSALTHIASVQDQVFAYPTTLLDATSVACSFAEDSQPVVASRIRAALSELNPAAQRLLRRLSVTLSGLTDQALRDAGATPEELQQTSQLEQLGWLQPYKTHGYKRRLEGGVLLVLRADAARSHTLPPHPLHDVFVHHLLTSEAALRGPNQIETLKFFTEHADDVLQTIVQTAQTDDNVGLQVAASAWHLARRTGHVHLLAGHLEQLLDNQGRRPSVEQLDARSALGNLKLIQGRATQAYALHEGVLTALAEAPDTGTDPLHRATVHARSALTLAQIDARAGRSDQAQARLSEVDELREAPELAWFHAAASVNRGFVFKSEGRYQDAHAHLSKGAKALWGLQDTMGEASARIGALASLARGSDATAAVRQQEALEKCFERMNGLGIGPLAAPLADAMRDLQQGGFSNIAAKLGVLHEQASAASGRLES